MRRRWFSVLPFLALFLAVPVAAAEPAASWDGRVEVSSPKIDVACLMPGADFRSFRKIMFDKPKVAFRKNWLRDMNSGMRHRVDDADVQKILATVQGNTSDIFAEAFTKAGYQVVAEPGEDVLRLRSGVIDLYVNAPDTMSGGRTRSFTANAGEATLVQELCDSLTNALLGHAVPRISGGDDAVAVVACGGACAGHVDSASSPGHPGS